MKCIYSVLKNDFYRVVIEKDIVYIEDRYERKELSVSKNDCITTLFSLFSLKENWISEECDDPIYKIDFINGEKVCEYTFESMVPSNFYFFSSFVVNLIGDALL